MVGHTCHPSTPGGQGREITSLGPAWATCWHRETLSQNKKCKKGWYVAQGKGPGFNPQKRKKERKEREERSLKVHILAFIFFPRKFFSHNYNHSEFIVWDDCYIMSVSYFIKSSLALYFMLFDSKNLWCFKEIKKGVSAIRTISTPLTQRLATEQKAFPGSWNTRFHLALLNSLLSRFSRTEARKTAATI